MLSDINKFLNKENPKSLFLLIFIFVSAIVFATLFSNQTLIYEWADIVPNLIKTGDYKYQGHFSAFMPPFYPYYLKICASIFGGSVTNWLAISIIIQSIIYCMSIISLHYVIFRDKIFKFYSILSVLILLFFPPIFFGLVRNSSFGITTAIYIFCYCTSQLFIDTKKTKYILLFLVISCIGFYTRWDFIAYFLFMSSIIILNSTKNWVWLIIPILVSVLFYLPWSIRNYEKIGTYAYNSVSGFAFSKGNNLKFKLWEQTNGVDYSGIKLDTVKSELQLDKQFKINVKKYIINNPKHFIKMSIGKLFINFTQYFPESYNGVYIKSNKYIGKTIAIIYSIIFVLFSFVIFVNLWKYFKSNSLFAFTPKNYFYQFVLISLIFHFGINTFMAPPLPRYILFYLPFFLVFVIRTFSSLNNQNL